MKIKLQVILVLIIVFVLPSLSFPENPPYTVSLPDKIPGVVSQVAQKDKAAIVLIRAIVSGTAESPSFVMVQAGAGSIVGSWQSSLETVTFTEGGQFSGTNAQSGAFGGTYFVQGNILTFNYAIPMPISRQFTFTLAGNTLTVYNPQTGAVTYVKVGAGPAAEGNFIANAENLMLVVDTGPGAQIVKEPVTTYFKGTGFIVSTDGYIITNAHVILAGEDLKDILFETGADNLKLQLLNEVEKLYKIPHEQKGRIVEILYKKALGYFVQYGRIKDINVHYEVFSGIAVPGEDLKVKSWPAIVKKQGTATEKIGEEISWGKDIAIIKVDKSNLPTVSLGDSSKVQVGDPIFIIGYPGIGSVRGFFKQESILEPTTTQGVISAKRILKTGTETLQTDAAINHGNSGGPAYNDKGEVIGIATFGSGPEEGIEAIKFLIAINHAKEFMQELNIENKHSILDKKYAEALNGFWKRDCRKAISKMKEVLALYPGHPYAQYYINECENARLTGKLPKPLNIPIIVVILVALGIVIFAASIFFKKNKKTPS